MSIWPILISTEEIPPMVIAIWYGESKPTSVDDYMYKFLEESQKLMSEGVNINGYHYSIKSLFRQGNARW